MPPRIVLLRALTESGHIGVIVILWSPLVAGVRDQGGLIAYQCAMRPICDSFKLPHMDEKNPYAPVTPAHQNPQARRNVGQIEKLAQQRGHALHKPRPDQVFTNLAFAGLT